MFISFRFKWSNLMDEDEKTVTNNVDEDMASMMFAAGMWHLEHAHLVSVVSFKIMHCFSDTIFSYCHIFVNMIILGQQEHYK